MITTREQSFKTKAKGESLQLKVRDLLRSYVSEPSLIQSQKMSAHGEEQPKQNKRDQIIKGVQDSYAMSSEPVDVKARVANAKDKADKLKDKILESLKLND